MQFRKQMLAAMMLAVAPVAFGQTTQPAADVAAPVAAKAPTTQGVDPDKVVIRIGDRTMTVKEYADLVNDVLPEQSRPMAMGPAKRMFADKIVEIKLFAAEAAKRGLDKDPKVQRQMALLREQVLATAAMDAVQKSMDEASMKKYLEDHKADFEQVKARHILVRVAAKDEPADPSGKKLLNDADAKKKADDIRARLVKGEDFAAIAKAESDDPGSASRGGDLGSFRRHTMVPQFEEAAFSGKVGEVSQPVKTPYGYHIIQVQEHNAPAFEALHDEIAERMAPAQMEKTLQELKKTEKVEIDEAYFGKPAPAGMPAMPPAE